MAKSQALSSLYLWAMVVSRSCKVVQFHGYLIFCGYLRYDRMIYMHYIIHGFHHKHPMDGDRLVFPPLYTAAISSAVSTSKLLLDKKTSMKSIFPLRDLFSVIWLLENSHEINLAWGLILSNLTSRKLAWNQFCLGTYS